MCVGVCVPGSGVADTGRPVPPQHLYRLGEDASLRLQRAKQPRRRLVRHPDCQGRCLLIFDPKEHQKQFGLANSSPDFKH